MADGTKQQQGDQPPTEPILSINTTAHTARIWRIATDRENRYAVTASEDKTARVWSLPDSRLLTVLRVPLGEGALGKLLRRRDDARRQHGSARRRHRQCRPA
jgi:hypothetical protein